MEQLAVPLFVRFRDATWAKYPKPKAAACCLTPFAACCLSRYDVIDATRAFVSRSTNLARPMRHAFARRCSLQPAHARSKHRTEAFPCFG